MTLRLNGSTSGYVELQAAAVAANNTMTLPSSGDFAATTQLGPRNLIINGAMEVWQRGTSQTTSGGYGADRFWMANATSAARSTDAPAGFTYSTKLTYNASDMATGQPIELPATGKQGQLVAGETVTLSYYAKVDSGTESIGTSIKFRDSKFSSTNEVIFTSSNANATWTTTWTRYTHQFAVPTVGSTNILAGLEIAGISKDAYITGVQLERGSVATPFEHRSYGDELARCQRYYETCYQQGLAPGSSTSQNNILAVCPGNINRAYGHLQFQVKKRASATVVFFSTSGASGKFRNASQGTDITMSAACSIGDSGISYEASSGIVSVTDRMQGLYTAEAEL